MKPHGFILRSISILLLFGAASSHGAAGPEKVSDSAMQQIAALQQEKLSRSPTHRKLDSQFLFQLKRNRNQIIAPGVTALQPDIHFQADGRVLVDIDANVTEALITQITKSGGTVVNSFPQFHAIRALVILDQLEPLAGSEDVKFVYRARQPKTNTGSVTSEGDVTHRANIARSTFGISGLGVKVGVLSDSVDYLANSQTTGELGDVTVLPGQNGYGSGEGTALLEVIHDLAPGARLYFATATGSEASFAQNILNLRSNGCDIIVDDIAYPDESPFQDGLVAQAVNTVTAGGALYFSAAGNDGNLKHNTSGTWEGDFADGGLAGPPVNSGGGSLHSFGPATFNTVVSAGLGLELFWADPLGASTNDYDLFVLDSTGTYVVASSLNSQTGTQVPYESISYVNSAQRIVIVKTSGDGRFLHLQASRGRLSYHTSGATKGHSATAAAFGVAAVNVASAYPSPFTGGSQNPVEASSSDGPRRVFFNPDGTSITPGNYTSSGGAVLHKPDLAAADGVMTSLYNFQPFFGTSAAAAHAAAIAALLLSYNPALTPDQVRTALGGSALDIEDPGIDSISGAGIVMAYEALQSFPPRPQVIASGSALLLEGCPNGVVDPGETLTVGLALANAGIANTTNLVATLLPSGGVTAPSGPQSYGVLVAKGGAISRPFTFVAAGSCGGTNVATLHLQDGPNDLGTVRFSFQVGNPRVPLIENFDGATPPALPPGWTVSQAGAVAAWQTTGGWSDTSPNSVFVPDLAANGETSLISPSFPVASTSAQLSFRHSPSLYYYGYDGGVLEISIGEGAFVDILSAGGTFVANGYYSFLYTGYGNPLGGRMAWTGYSGGFITSVVNLPATAAGQNVRLRWRFGSSGIVGGGSGYGWYVDSVLLNDGWGCCAQVPNDLVVNITGSPDPVVVGGTLNYTINLFNTGPSPVQNVSLTDVLPPSFTLQSISLSQGLYPGPQPNSGGTVTFNLASLPAGGNATIGMAGTVDTIGLITNRVSVGRSDTDGNPTNNSAAAVTSVILPSLAINDVTLFDGSSGTTNALFTVTLWPPPYQAVTIDFATSDLSAIADIDYVKTNGTLVFAPGVTNQVIAVAVIGNTLNKPNQAFALNLANPTNAILARSQGLGTILNDDPWPILSASDASVAVPNSGSTDAVFNVSLNVPSGQIVNVSYYSSDGTAVAGSDYVPVYFSQLTFNPGETNKTVPVTVNPHVRVKPAQTFSLNLTGPNNAKLGRTQALGTIITAFPQQTDHLVWSAIPSPQSNGSPFAVTITAQDYFNSTVSNFAGVVALSGSASNGQTTNTILSSPAYSDSGSGILTLGYAFTPNKDLTVTHVRHFFGSKVSIWTDAGLLLASQSVTSSPSTWVETPLSKPVELLAGTRYRVAVYSANASNATNATFYTYYWRYDLPPAFPDGTIDQSYETYGDAFPNNLDSAHWWLVDLRYTGPLSVPIPLTPAFSAPFSNGLWTGSVIAQLPGTNVTLLADDGLGHVGQSLSFDVAPLPGRVTHFAWSPIASPQSNGAPFAISITAQDYFNATATNFTGPVTLSGSGTVGVTKNILGSPSYTGSGAGTLTLGYAFTPRTNILVTHFRHYFGTRVSIWNDAGSPLVSRIVTSTNGIWRETQLANPLPLLAGQRYRVGVYTGGGNYYSRNDLPGTFPDATIDQSYEASGTAFPTNPDSARWWLVDLRYTVGVPAVVPVTPTNANNFADGIWSGNIAALDAATKVTFRANDGFGHVGQSGPFDVLQAPGQVTHFVWSPISSPQSNGVPFAVTITAEDYLNNPATNFTGTVALTGLSGASRTNTMFGDVTPASSGGGDFTLGNAFTPSTNIIVTHIRHYFGTKVSLWTDAGVLLATQNGPSALGTWVETALPVAVQLTAGQTYRVGVYTAGGNYFWRNDQSSSFGDGMINQGCEISGDGFPANLDTVRWWLVEIRYTVGTAVSIPVTPVTSDNFVSGLWSGNVTVLQGLNDVSLLADDRSGHIGQSLPFDMAHVPVVVEQPQPDTRFAGGTAAFSVSADGSRPLYYQWLFNGTGPIPGATNSSYLLSGIQPANGGNYSCVVSNVVGTVASSNALLTVALPTAGAFFDLNSNPSNLFTLWGSAHWVASAGVSNTGFLALTDNINNQHGTAVFPELLPGQTVRSFNAAMMARIGGGTSPPADGFSINLARLADPVLTDGRSFLPAPDGSDPGAAEEGTQTGLSLNFDTWPNGPTDLIGIDVRVDGNIIAQYPLPTLNGAANDPASLQTGPVNNLSWVPLVVSLREDGSLEVYYKGVLITPAGGLQTYFSPGPGQFVLGARTGGNNEVHHFDNISFGINFAVSPVTLSVRSVDNQPQLTWPGGVLQSAGQAEGPYTDVPGAISPYAVAPTAPEQFFRVKVK